MFARIIIPQNQHFNCNGRGCIRLAWNKPLLCRFARHNFQWQRYTLHWPGLISQPRE